MLQFTSAIFVIAFIGRRIDGAAPIFIPSTPNDTGLGFKEELHSSPISKVFTVFANQYPGIDENLTFLPALPKKGTTYNIVKRDQVWNKIKVFGFAGTWRVNNSQLIQGKFLQGINEDLTSKKAKINKRKAFDLAVAYFNKTKEDRNVKDTNPSNGKNKRFKKIIFLNPKTSRAHLAYKFDFLALFDNPPGFTNVFITVDAKTGDIIDSFEQLLTADVDNKENITDFPENKSSFETFQSTFLKKKNYVAMFGDGGNINTNRYRFGSNGYQKRLLRVTVNNETNSCRPENPLVLVASALGKPFHFPLHKCFDRNFNQPYEEACNPPSPNKDATENSYSQVHDALYFATEFRKILQKQFDDTTLKDCCGQVKLCVHFQKKDTSLFFHENNCETYYGVSGNNMLDMASPSIIGHELGHALVYCTSNLKPQCQSGAILESFGDLCGLLLKASLNNFEPDWMIGSEVTKKKNGTVVALRYMDDPPRDGLSIDHTNDYTCEKEVHHNAGIYNKAIFNLINMKRWNLKKVFQLFLHANKFFWTSTISFNEGLCGLLRSASELDVDIADVELAFDSSGVHCKCQYKGMVGDCKAAKDCARKDRCPGMKCSASKVCCFKGQKPPTSVCAKP